VIFIKNKTMTLTIEIDKPADYDLLVQLLQKMEGVRIPAQQKSKKTPKTKMLVAEEEVRYDAATKPFDPRDYQGCWTYPATFEETVAKLEEMRNEWDSHFSASKN
jgi:hypothetical protein